MKLSLSPMCTPPCTPWVYFLIHEEEKTENTILPRLVSPGMNILHMASFHTKQSRFGEIDVRLVCDYPVHVMTVDSIPVVGHVLYLNRRNTHRGQ